jgi:hypothetical protein
MLAYVFWHRPSAPDQAAEYEDALISFHRSLARSLPVGTRASAVFRVAELPWAITAGGSGAPEGGYEDWYLLDDFASLGVLNEAAVGIGHRTTHDAAARRFGAGAGGLYGLIEGEPCAAALGEASKAIWIARPPGAPRRDLDEMLGDGMEPSRASLWRRQLVLGPAPEYCLLADEMPPGVGADRLPAGWSATTLEREVLWNG